MRKIIVIATALATALAAISPTAGWAQGVGAPSPVVVATFNAFPDGGQELTDRCRGLILQNNALANDVASYLRSGKLSAAQRAAGEKCLAEALGRLGVGDVFFVVLAAAVFAGVFSLERHTVSPN